MTFKEAYRIYDAIKAYSFEGAPSNYSFTTEEWFYSRTTQKWYLTLPDKAMSLELTKIMNPSITVMKNKVEALIKNKGDIGSENVKMVVNSAHDDQISSMLVWLDAVDFEFIDVPYASTVIYELRYD